MGTDVGKTTPMNTFLSIVLLCLVCGGCGGDDGFIFIAVNTGFVVSNGACDGEFNMRNNGGLLLIVVIGSGTPVFLPNGTLGSCANILPGSPVSVRGPTQNGRVTANQVQLK